LFETDLFRAVQVEQVELSEPFLVYKWFLRDEGGKRRTQRSYLQLNKVSKADLGISLFTAD
jgi:hypothetical protein